MTRYIAIFLTLATSISLGSFAQENAPASLKSDLVRYAGQRLQEKVFLHTDKPSYLAGEFCWFKLYVMDAGNHHPLDISKVAYLEWIDTNNKPVLQTKIALQKGHGNGSVFLPYTLSSGNYKLRAYTSWMKNDGEDWVFEKSVTIINPRRAVPSAQHAAPARYAIAFFPEGGHMVERASGRIAYKVTDQYGNGIACTGVITEDDQDTVARCATHRFGIGSFTLTPRPGRRYRATFRLADGSAVNQLLPAPDKEGMTMTVTDEDADHIRVDIRSSTGGAEVYLVAHTRRSVKMAEAAPLRQGTASFTIDRRLLGEGISSITIFNEARRPMCERLVFKYPAHPMDLSLRTDRNSYAAREKISLQVNAARQADASLSVFRLDSLQSLPQSDITAYVYISSDLTGRIDSAAWYLQHPEDRQAMDELMLSHGWRRFRWEDVTHHAVPGFRYPMELNGPIISGTVIDTRNGNKAEAVQAFISVPGTRTQFSTTYSNGDGQVHFEMKDLYGSQEIIVQTNSMEDSMYRIDVDNPFLERYTASPLPACTINPSLASLLNERSISAQAVARYDLGKLRQLRFPAADTTPFYYKADHTYLLDDYTRFTTMEEVMREYVTLMLVKRIKGRFHLPLFDMPNNKVFDTDPLILLDGVPVFDVDKFMALDPLKIRRLETLQRKYFLGGASFDGIMNWMTYKGDLGGYILDPHATVVDYEGLQLDREFYSPSYAEGQAPDKHLPDLRNVLYWTPAVPMDASGKGTLEFYASDVPGKYAVIIEGLAADGTPGSSLATFDVGSK